MVPADVAFMFRNHRTLIAKTQDCNIYTWRKMVMFFRESGRWGQARKLWMEPEKCGKRA
jgi:hypothetical protein